MTIHIENLVCGYPGGFSTRPVSFRSDRPEIIGIIGPNGSGKSTFAKTLLGLLPPLSGFIKKPDDASFNWGYLPQQSEVNNIMPISAGEVVESGNTTDADKAVTLLGDPFQILPLFHHSFHKLSGGQKQRVLLTRVFVGSNSPILLDEPTNTLDEATKEILWQWLFKQKTDAHRTIFVIDHDVKMLGRFCDQLIDLGEPK